MVQIRVSYRKNGRERKILEKDKNDNYYNVILDVKVNGQWKNKYYYKYSSKQKAKKVYGDI